MMRMTRTLLFATALSVTAVACGHSSGGGGFNDGTPSSDYPAPHPALPQVLDNGGPVLAHPVFTAVSFPGDPFVPLLDQFTATIGATSYWKVVGSSYGFGAAVATSAVHYSQAAPANTTTTEVEAWLTSMLSTTASGFPAPSANSVYVLYYPAGTVVTDTSLGLGTSCQDYYAYHYTIQVAGNPVAYALIPRCPGFSSLSDVDVATVGASHELAEASSDPIPNTGYSGLSNANAAWQGGEIGDMCESIQNSNVEPTGFAFATQRIWSNLAAAAGHDPCQPQSLPYFMAAPVLPDTFDVSGQGFTLPGVNGVSVPKGQTKTLDLELFSDSDTVGPFFVSAQQLIFSQSTAGNLALTLDRDEGVNGEVLHLTIHTLTDGTSFLPGFDLIQITTEDFGQQNTWPFFIQD